MNIVHEKPTTDKTQSDTPQEPQGCMLGRELGNCPIRRKGCGSLYEAMQYVLPPYHVRLLVREHLTGDKSAQDWLKRLDDLLPEPRPTLLPRRGDW